MTIDITSVPPTEAEIATARRKIARIFAGGVILAIALFGLSVLYHQPGGAIFVLFATAFFLTEIGNRTEALRSSSSTSLLLKVTASCEQNEHCDAYRLAVAKQGRELILEELNMLVKYYNETPAQLQLKLRSVKPIHNG